MKFEFSVRRIVFLNYNRKKLKTSIISLILNKFYNMLVRKIFKRVEFLSSRKKFSNQHFFCLNPRENIKKLEYIEFFPLKFLNFALRYNSKFGHKSSLINDHIMSAICFFLMINFWRVLLINIVSMLYFLYKNTRSSLSEEFCWQTNRSRKGYAMKSASTSPASSFRHRGYRLKSKKRKKFKIKKIPIFKNNPIIYRRFIPCTWIMLWPRTMKQAVAFAYLITTTALGWNKSDFVKLRFWS